MIQIVTFACSDAFAHSASKPTRLIIPTQKRSISNLLKAEIKKFNTKTFGKNNKNNELNLEKFYIDVKQDKNIKVIKMLNLLISNNLIY